LYVKAGGVEFKMIPVAGYSGGFFLIGETEVTEALYYAMNGSNSSSQKPISSISYSYAIYCIEKINNATKLNFSIPTADQWKYAAKGGNKSQNYTYSGSNTPGDVAWYSANTSTKQNVKTKAPNELGIYDMSGNVSEYTYSSSSSSSKNCYGGDYTSNSNGCTTSSYYSDYGEPTIGFRLILTCQ
jgi:formylglycine-generating enzyme required for sulfatase activity